jgi:pimeloyl-ACP methyl ester carboxylesterase
MFVSKPRRAPGCDHIRVPVKLDADREGFVVRDGVSVHFQSFGSAPRAVLLLPTWSIVHSDFWRWQVPHLARKYNVITYDGRGNGKSDRPADPAAYADDQFAADAIAVLDEMGVAEAAIMSVSAGAAWGLMLAAGHPDRVPASVFIAPSIPITPPIPERIPAMQTFNDTIATQDGWFKFNRRYWHDNWPDFLQFFFSQCFTEPNSDDHIAHFVGMGLDTTPRVIAATVDAPGPDGATFTRLASEVPNPVLVIHGDKDAISPHTRGAELARLAGGRFVSMSGSGHEPQCRIPDEVNAILDDFLAEHFPA